MREALFNIEQWLDSGGLILLAGIVFAESGLLIGFFLPGDSLLFIAGFLASEAGGRVLPPLPLVAGVTVVAAIIGDQFGYWFGRRFGPAFLTDPNHGSLIRTMWFVLINFLIVMAPRQLCWPDSFPLCVLLPQLWLALGR